MSKLWNHKLGHPNHDHRGVSNRDALAADVLRRIRLHQCLGPVVLQVERAQSPGIPA